MSAEKQKVKVVKVVRETEDAVSIYFDGASFPYKYESGQYLTIVADINGEEVRRPYSLCTAQDVDDNPGVTVKRVSNGKMSNFLNDNCKEGMGLDLMETMGNFRYIPKESNGPIVLIGGGSGVTPLMSILKKTLKEEADRKIFFIYANTNKETTIFYKELGELNQANENLKLELYMSDDNKVTVQQPKGLKKLFKKAPKIDPNAHRLNSSRLSEILKYFNVGKEAEVFVCGPEGLMKTVEETVHVNFSSWKFNQEKFFSTKEADYEKAAGEGKHDVTITVNGETHQIEVGAVKSILFEGLDKGIDLPFSCQSGLCTACMGKCTSGKVEMTENSGLTDQEVAEGYILTCTGHPKSDVVIEIE